MATLRNQALNLVQTRSKVEVKAPSKRISDYFGEMAFTKGSNAINFITGCIQKGELCN